MKFLVDENFHLAIYQFLKDQGYDATSVAKDYSSFEDLEILSIANKEKRVIIFFYAVDITIRLMSYYLVVSTII